MVKIIAISNQKGGVGKTTTTAAFGAVLAEKGFKVLEIDLDPQGNLSYSSGANAHEYMTVYDLLTRKTKEVSDVIQKVDKVDIIPSNIQLAGAEQELHDIGKELRTRIHKILCYTVEHEKTQKARANVPERPDR